MAEVVQEKSRGLKFAEQQLLRHGWEHGKHGFLIVQPPTFFRLLTVCWFPIQSNSDLFSLFFQVKD